MGRNFFRRASTNGASSSTVNHLQTRVTENAATPSVVTTQPQSGNYHQNVTNLPPSYSYEGRNVPGPTPYGPPPPYSATNAEYRCEFAYTLKCTAGK